MENDKCFYCKMIIVKNTPIYIKHLTSIGYQEYPFCSRRCLMEELNKKGFFTRLYEKLRKGGK